MSHLPLQTVRSSARLHRLRELGALGATEPRDRGDGAGGQGLRGSRSPLPAPTPVRPLGAVSESGAAAQTALGARKGSGVLRPPGASEGEVCVGVGVEDRAPAADWRQRHLPPRLGRGFRQPHLPPPLSVVGSPCGGSPNGPSALLKGLGGKARR